MVGPVLLRHLRSLDIPVELYAPHGGSLVGETQLALLNQDDGQDESHGHLAPWLVAVAEIVNRLEAQRYHWPVGRLMLQKIVYFATVAGLPTGLEFVAASFGPYAPDLKAAVGHMQNNGLIVERHRGQMFEVLSGPAVDDARLGYRDQVAQWNDLIDRIVDLAARFNNREAEIAATVHYTADDPRNRLGRPPTIAEVITAVEEWKRGRQPKVTRDAILRAVVNLGTRGWLTVDPDTTTAEDVANMVVGGSLVG